MPLRKEGHSFSARFFMDDQQLVFSRFTHIFEKDGVVAFMNALKLRPVFIVKAVADALNSAIQAGAIADFLSSTDKIEGTTAKGIIDALREEKILIENNEYDDYVLSNVRSVANSPKIRVAYFLMTDDCNLDCSYCFIKKGMAAGYATSSMTPATAFAGLDMYARLSAGDDKDERTIVIYGGEPLLNAATTLQLINRITEYKNNGKLHSKTITSIVTNGTLLTDEILEAIKANGVALGISIDGFMLAQDNNRKFTSGQKSYNTVMAAVEKCREHGVEFSISSTISWDNINNFDETMNTILNVIKPSGVGFNILMDKTCAASDNDDYADKAADFIVEAFKIFREHGIYEDRIMRKAKAFVEGKMHIFDCAAAGGNQIVIAPDGQVGICQAFIGTRDYFVSHVTEADFEPSANEAFIEWKNRAPVNMEECLDCEGLGICGGGCPYNSYVTEGSIWGLDKRFCKHTLKSLEFLIWDLYEQNRPITERGSIT